MNVMCIMEIKYLTIIKEYVQNKNFLLGKWLP